MALAQLFINGIEDGVRPFCQRDIDGIIGGKVVPQFPNTAQQRRVRAALRGELGKSRKQLLAAGWRFGLSQASGARFVIRLPLNRARSSQDVYMRPESSTAGDVSKR